MLDKWLAPTPAQRLTRGDRLLLAVLSLAVLLPGTFGVSLTDRDEGWYAQVSREMLAGGDWLIPRYLGQPWIAKPPLLYWCVASCFAIFGLHVWAARLVCVLAAVGAVQLVGTLAAGLYNRRVGVLACVSFVTAGLPVVVSKMLLTDSLLLLWCLVASVSLWRIATGGPTVVRALVLWVAVGLGILTKGPAVLLFVGAFGLALLFRPDARARLLSTTLLATGPACLAVAAPWYLYATGQAGDTLARQFLWYEVASRIAGTPHGHGGPPGYYVLLSLAGWLPWTALVPGAVIETWRGRREDRAAGLLLVWCGLPWLVLELIHSKLPHYVLPCYVPLAIMLGRMWDVGLERPPTRAQRAVLVIWAAVGLGLGVGLLAAAWYWRALPWAPAAAASGAVLVAAFTSSSLLKRRGHLRGALVGVACGTVLFHITVGLWLLPGFEPYRLSRLIAERANELGRAGTQVMVCGYTEPSMFFYLREPACVIGAAEIAALLDDAPVPRVLIVRDVELAAATRGGLAELAAGSNAHRINGFNYVKGRWESVWVLYQAGPSTRRQPSTTAPAKT